MDTFAALNRLGDLHAVTYHRHAESPDVLYLLAWDERSQNQVCWLILGNANDHYGKRWALIDYMLDHVLPDTKHVTGIAFTGSNRPLHQWDDLDFDPVRLSADEYAAIMEAV